MKKWSISKTTQVIALAIASGAIAAFAASALIPDNSTTETIKKESI